MAATDVVTRFNASINARDPEGLSRLMTGDHVFIDSAGESTHGKEACLDAWRGFFEGFPDYRNTFLSLEARDDVVVVTGFSSCSFQPLDGPALWRAQVRGDQVSEWRVLDDTPANRAALLMS